MADVPSSPARHKLATPRGGFVYRGIEIVPAFDDDRSRRIEADMREVAARMGLPG